MTPVNRKKPLGISDQFRCTRVGPKVNTCKKSVYSKGKEPNRSVWINHIVIDKRNTQDSGFYFINVNKSTCRSPLESKAVILTYLLLLI